MYLFVLFRCTELLISILLSLLSWYKLGDRVPYVVSRPSCYTLTSIYLHTEDQAWPRTFQPATYWACSGISAFKGVADSPKRIFGYGRSCFDFCELWLWRGQWQIKPKVAGLCPLQRRCVGFQRPRQSKYCRGHWRAGTCGRPMLFLMKLPDWIP